MELRQWARTWRAIHHLTQDEISTRLGISKTSYCNYENGHSELHPQNARKLVAIIGDPPSEAPGRVAEPAPPPFGDRLLLTPCDFCGEETPVAYKGRRYLHCAHCGQLLP